MDQGSRLPLSTPSSPSATRRSTPQCKEKAKDAGDNNSAGALPWRRLTATTEHTSKGGLLKLLGCKMGPDSAKVQANLAPKELTVAKGQSPGAKGARRG